MRGTTERSGKRRRRRNPSPSSRNMDVMTSLALGLSGSKIQLSRKLGLLLPCENCKRG